MYVFIDNGYSANNFIIACGLAKTSHEQRNIMFINIDSNINISRIAYEGYTKYCLVWNSYKRHLVRGTLNKYICTSENIC